MMSEPTAFTCDPKNFVATNAMRHFFLDEGYLLVRGMFDEEEIANIRKALEGSDLFSNTLYAIEDDEGAKTRMTLWRHPGNDVTGKVARCGKVAGTAEKLLGGEVYHYHSKLMAKDPNGKGGKFVWHQDYGYWYKNGCLYPDMLSVFIPIDPCRKENGCLQILAGSHKCGRIDHGFVAGQQGCDLERLEQVKAKLPLKVMEMEPGDVMFHHSNLLHCSGPNTSATKRWSLVCCYNRASNDPVIPHHCPCYTPLDRVPDAEVRECRNYTDLSGKDFMDPSTDATVKVADD
ncbi:L-proline trans-4-hydroxylase-like [Babylonia areolata]|uniref:L-proline trans-4-hydroxylase-like n=1 Tax=Babylonia areolata TaxID=304850 RepID=UPI003FD08403